MRFHMQVYLREQIGGHRRIAQSGERGQARVDLTGGPVVGERAQVIEALCARGTDGTGVGWTDGMVGCKIDSQVRGKIDGQRQEKTRSRNIGWLRNDFCIFLSKNGEKICWVRDKKNCFDF